MPTDTVADRHLWPLIKGIKFAMFTTHDGIGHLHSRPMATQNQTMPDDKLWIFMSAKGDTAQELTDRPQVDISYADPGKDVYVSVSGSAQMVDDQAQHHALWTTFAQTGFASGVGDPDLALVCVTVTYAHHGNVRENKLTQLLVMAKAVFTGEKPGALDESGKVVLAAASRLCTDGGCGRPDGCPREQAVHALAQTCCVVQGFSANALRWANSRCFIVR